MKKLLLLLFVLLFSISGFSQAGFYKKDTTFEGNYISLNPLDTNHYNVLYAPNAIHTPTWSIVKELKDTYSYPVHDWWWAETEEQALSLLNLKGKN